MGAVAVIIIGSTAVVDCIIKSGNAVFEIYMRKNPRVKHCNAYTFAGDAARGRAAAVDQVSDIVHLKCLSCGVFLSYFMYSLLFGVQIPFIFLNRIQPKCSNLKIFFIITLMNLQSFLREVCYT